MSPKVPKYRLHKATGQAVVTINGKDHYLGKHGTLASKDKYGKLISEHLGRPLPMRMLKDKQAKAPAPAGDDAPEPATIAELLEHFDTWCSGYYRKNGKLTSHYHAIKRACKALREACVNMPASKFGPLDLKALREKFIEAGLCRATVNGRIGSIKQFFAFATENEMIPPSVYHGLLAVKGLKQGRTTAPDPPPVGPVSEAAVNAIEPHVSRQVWAMVQLQWLTGMRPGEAMQMRTCDVNRTGKVWEYRPASHKTQHFGKQRVIWLGERAQRVLLEGNWFRLTLDEYLFQPREAMAAHYDARAALMDQGKGQARRSKRRRMRAGVRYSTVTYGLAIRRGCQKAGIESWAPNMLRHAAATRLRRELGDTDGVRTVLGQSSIAMTERYAREDHDAARRIMERYG
jgi:integrase